MTLIDATYDLKTGVGRKPDPLDYITKKTACRVAPPGTPHPLWDKFLARVTNSNTELIRFLQRMCGYCCTGITREHVFFFLYGTGANGKSTFVNTVRDILGDYATVADMSTFLLNRTPQHQTDLAKLRGARLVVAIETQKGRRWDEAKISAITGGDMITARFMRQNFFDYRPTFKLVICGNHKPQISSVNEAMRRRLILIPFTVKIPKAERDLEFPDKLRPEWPAIQRWMIDGCLEWQRIGLAPPKIVTDATDAYFTEEDTVQQWLDECTEINDKVQPDNKFIFTRTTELFASWKAWCEPRNQEPGSEKAFSETLRNKNFTKDHNTLNQAGWRKLTFKTKKETDR
jgi:putative DNA primase/helicase